MNTIITSEETARRMTAIDYLALTIATGLGSGYAPIAPGTFGSVVGVALYFAVQTLRLDAAHLYAVMMVVALLVSYVGTWTSTRAAILMGVKDPSKVVVDEVAGQFITYAFLPIAPKLSLVVIGFILFRFFDIVKPYPIRRLEKLEGGLGIMADDILAGLYAGIILFLINLSFFVGRQ